VRRVLFVFFFVVIVGGAFILGAQSIVPDKTLMFSHVEDREPANLEEGLRGLVGSAAIKQDENYVSLINFNTEKEEVSICALLPNIRTYTVVSEVEGLMESGSPVVMYFESDCSDGVFKIFDKALCEVDSSQLRAGVDFEKNRAQINGLFVPIRKVEFFLKSLSVDFEDGKREDLLIESNNLSETFSCKEAKL
jgi:hypothetical protein